MRDYGQFKLPSNNIWMDSEQKKLLISTGKPEKFPVWYERFLAYIDDKIQKMNLKKKAKPTRTPH